MERKSCCSGRSCCPSARAVRPVATPKKEPVVMVKTPKAEDVKPEMIKNAAVKVEKKETGNVTAVKKEEAVKVNVGCGGATSYPLLIVFEFCLSHTTAVSSLFIFANCFAVKTAVA
ncbi:hypothetical protein DCAR_0313959 [Daucus carota subsp. sativus]|uniref:Uncharacterized protein n=1 Tax=Daucus carota subsp. sativus TaxID=79200 RepID=A0A166CBY3_DAUCS|nr:hypothetical protein DCAR_0313959 [Daucus carota subsp. sativus]